MKELRKIIRNILNESILTESSVSDKDKFNKYFSGVEVKDFKGLKYPKDDSGEVKKELSKIKSIDLDMAFVQK